MAARSKGAALVAIILAMSCGDDGAILDPTANGGAAGDSEHDREGGAAGTLSAEPGRGGDTGRGGATGSGDGGEPSVDACPESCDDGFDCTVDSCRAGSCVHTIGPNEGATACPSGRYCTVEDGCVTPPACETDEDCIETWADDACKADPRCDSASSLCLFDVLDKDNDGHPPQVCGGDDCDDSPWNCAEGCSGGQDVCCVGGQDVFPGAPERCNGEDDDCDGEVDERATCDDPNEACVLGYCDCKVGYEDCSGSCVDTASDAMNCGDCGYRCRTDEECVDGECECPLETVRCSDGGCGLAERELCQDSSGPLCCYGTLCFDGSCTTCRDMGESCSPTEPCCTGICEDGACRQECRSPGEACEDDDSCCKFALCIEGSCCGWLDYECSSGSDCCDGYCAPDGTCDWPPDSGAGGTSGAGGAGGAGGEPGTAGAGGEPVGADGGSGGTGTFTPGECPEGDQNYYDLVFSIEACRNYHDCLIDFSCDQTDEACRVSIEMSFQAYYCYPADQTVDEASLAQACAQVYAAVAAQLGCE